jgi:hypothetical protein
VVDHFFDDYFLVEPKCLAASAVWAFRHSMHLFGFIIDKSQLPSTVCRALGAHFDMQAIRSPPRTRQTWYTYTAVPETVIQEWLPSGQQVHLVELFAGPLALDTFKKMLSNRYLIHFIDNSAALKALVKGYSPSEDNIKIVGDYWLRAASRKLLIYCWRASQAFRMTHPG